VLFEEAMSAKQPTDKPPLGMLVLTGLTFCTIAASAWHVFLNTPSDATLGIVQKIFYWHVGAAFGMLLGMVTASLASLLDLVSPNDRVDAIARATMEVGVVFALMVLTSGPIWARKSWGTYWTWEPRLTLTLLVLLLALAITAIRGLAADSESGRKIAAALGVLGAPAAYLIHVAVKLWGGTHPTVIDGGGIRSTEMRVSFWLSVAAMLLLCVTFIVARYRQIRIAQDTRELRLTLSARALEDNA